MSYFLLPKVNSKIYEKLDYIKKMDISTEGDISNSLYLYLLNLKSKIDEYNNWDIIKRYTNPYEYIHTNVNNGKSSICKYKPLSRSYFKMIEIINTFQLLEYFSKNKTSLCIPPGFSDISIKVENNEEIFKSFHLAEGPGGFIEAILNLRKNPKDIYIGMTLVDDLSTNIPGWKKSRNFLMKNPNIKLEYGADNTGNILKLENLDYCVKKYGSSMNFMTGDGGFDFSLNFNEQEKVIVPLLFAQLCYAVLLQKKGGVFILKLFDSFINSTIDIIYLLCSFYKKVYIIKPRTSRYANSEKYIVCIDFLYSSNHEFIDFFRNTFIKMTNNMGDTNSTIRFLKCNIQYYFIKRVEECNSVIGKQQLENIYNTINLIENKHRNDKFEYLKKHNIQKCIEWCIDNNMPYYD